MQAYEWILMVLQLEYQPKTNPGHIKLLFVFDDQEMI